MAKSLIISKIVLRRLGQNRAESGRIGRRLEQNRSESGGSWGGIGYVHKAVVSNRKKYYICKYVRSGLFGAA